MIELARQWQPRTLLIEDKGSGTALIQQLRAEANGIAYPTAFVPREDKLTRLHAQSARIEAGHVYLPERAPWRDGLRTELAAFPRVATTTRSMPSPSSSHGTSNAWQGPSGP